MKSTLKSFAIVAGMATVTLVACGEHAEHVEDQAQQQVETISEEGQKAMDETIEQIDGALQDADKMGDHVEEMINDLNN